MQLALGFVGAAIVSFAAWRARSLDPSGAVAATVVGTMVLGLGGWRWAALLLAFFISSSALTWAFRGRKSAVNVDYEKHGARDAGQVLGNGALPALLASLSYFAPYQGWMWIGFAAAVAAVNADTWATELGVLSRRRPRLITSFKKVEKGTSGGISFVGTLAALAGATFIGLLVLLLPPTANATIGNSSSVTDYWLLIAASGLLGSLFDSLLGATAQAMYYCPAHEKETERHPLHTCGTPTIHVRGWKWLGNDLVNFLCGLFGILVAWLMALAVPALL
jgi:uncharacterized protein (TIGR00297 family)